MRRRSREVRAHVARKDHLPAECNVCTGWYIAQAVRYRNTQLVAALIAEYRTLDAALDALKVEEYRTPREPQKDDDW